MPGIPARYLETFARLRRATDQLHRLIESGEFYAYGYLKRRKLIRRVRRLYGRLVGPVSPAIIGSAIAAAGVLSLAGCFTPTEEPPATAITPKFELRDATSIGLGFSDLDYLGQSYLVLADTDGDGELDLYFGAGRQVEGIYSNVGLQANDGSGHFDQVQFDAQNLVGRYRYNSKYWDMRPGAILDLDGDGLVDFVGVGTYSYDGNDSDGLLFAKNTGTATAPEFADPVPFAVDAGLPYAYDITGIAFVDIDGDGDLDLVSTAVVNPNESGYYGIILLTTNTSGSASSFTATSTIAFPAAQYVFDGAYLTGIAVTDLDNDGDDDILISGYTESDYWFRYIENTSADGNVSFASPVLDPFGLEVPWQASAGSRSRPVATFAVGDIDGDGDKDVIGGTYVSYDSQSATYTTEFFYFENTALP